MRRIKIPVGKWINEPCSGWAWPFGLHANGSIPLGHSHLHGHFKASEVGFMALKGEPKQKPVSESMLPAPSHGLINNQMRKRVPLGPQL